MVGAFYAFFQFQIEALPEIVAAVNGRCEVFVDGGFANGADMFKALALGANMVLSLCVYSVSSVSK